VKVFSNIDDMVRLIGLSVAKPGVCLSLIIFVNNTCGREDRENLNKKTQRKKKEKKKFLIWFI
jgi:hypothetical protein